MFKHLLKLIWNKKKQNSLLISEMLLSFLVIFAVFTFAVYAYTNYKTPMGFSYQNVWVVNFNNNLKIKDADSVKLFYQNLEQSIKSMPQVEDMTYTSGNVPFSSSTWTNGMTYNKIKISANVFWAETGYKNTVGVKLLQGRWYGDQDKADPRHVLVVNKAFAEKAFGKDNPIGKQLGDWEDKNKIKVIGVVDDMKFKNAYQPSQTATYSLCDTGTYRWVSEMMIRVRPGTDAAFESRLYKSLTGSLKNANVEIEHMSNKLVSANKFMLVPLIILSIVAAFLIINVALGLFGVLWYNINKRRGEIGLRRAVGADGSKVSWQLVIEAMILATFSLIVGSFFAIQFPLLNVFDLPAAVYLTALVLAIVFIYLLVLICSLYPGKQAAAIYPAVALHEE